jgi:ribosomal protein L31E
MTKTLENYIKKIKKLKNYLILQEKPAYLILGTDIYIKELIETRMTFSTYSTTLEKKLNVFFIVSLENFVAEDVWKEGIEGIESFQKMDIQIVKLPIFNEPISKISELIEHHLDAYIKTNM